MSEQPTPTYSAVVPCPDSSCPNYVGIKTGESQTVCDCGALVRP